MKDYHVTRTKLFAFSVVSLLIVLAAGEVSVRVWAYYFRTPYERYNPTLGRIELIPNIRIEKPNRRISVNSLGFVGDEFQAQKPQEVYRIFALGDSCTFGTGWEESTYPWILEQLLNNTSDRRRYEVINAGIEGYNSTWALARLKDEILRYDPDMVFVYIGWNDLMNRAPQGDRSESPRNRLLSSLMDNSYLIRAYRKLVFYYLRPLVVEPSVAPNEADFRAYDGFTPAVFQRNLEDIATVLRQNGVSTVFATLPTVVRRTMTREELRRSRVFFPYFAGSYSVDQFLSLHRAYNETVRSVAAKYSIPLVDLDREFNKYPTREGLFWDTMHPSKRGHVLIARMTFKMVAPTLKEEETK